ncbi:MAG: CBS domain-containing protein [Gammaproteobacteria bacterium]
MSVGEICDREVVVTGPDASIAAAARLMREHHVGDVVVVEGAADRPVPVGIVTDRDLVIEVLAEEVAPDSVTVRDVMSDRLLTAREQDGLWESLGRMRARGVRRMPVVDGQGALAGIVTVDDLLDLLAGELADLVKLVGREREREQANRQ